MLADIPIIRGRRPRTHGASLFHRPLPFLAIEETGGAAATFHGRLMSGGIALWLDAPALPQDDLEHLTLLSWFVVA